MDTEQGYYEPSTPKEDNVTSLYAEMLRSRDYGDKRYYPNYKELVNIKEYWKGEAEQPYRSDRAKREIGVLTTRILFELRERHYEIFSDLPMLEEQEA